MSEFIGDLKTPLEDVTLLLTKFEGVEGLAELFEFYVDALSNKENINFDPALGLPCVVTLKTYDNKERRYNGILAQAQWIGTTVEYNHYRMVLRPWPWLLAHRADCRIFLGEDVKEIIQDVFLKAGFGESNFEFRTHENYDKIPYCVQYRETDLAFVMRLMEEYGIYYFFEHDEGAHKMILADSRASLSPVQNLPSVPFYPDRQNTADKQYLGDWIAERKFSTGRIQYNDYDYLNPKKDLKAPKEAPESYAHSEFEVYDYPGKHNHQDKGKKFAQFRLEAEQALDHRRFVAGDAPSLYPGGFVTVEKHPTVSENGDYLVVRAAHRFSSQLYRSTSGPEAGEIYIGNYEFLPLDRPFRMLPLTSKPRIHGMQTARVVGKEGEDNEEISTDENGHIWVQFYWDREPKKSCPARCAQLWSGDHWGHQFIPRVGMEVIVEYLEGDPDRPLVSGCVYNGDHHFPYTLPDNKTQSGYKSNSTKGGGGYNEIMFEDKKGSELFRVHAQKDQLVVVNNNVTENVGGDETITVGGPTGGGNFTVNAFQTITLNVGPTGSPLTQIKMDQTSITLSVGPGGAIAQVKLDPSGVTISGTPVSQLMVQPSGITTMTPTITFLSGPVTFGPAPVTIPLAMIGAGTVGGALPII
jgi:type VI secretion system secreted protein VgrG